MGWLVAAWLLGMLGLVMAGETKLSRSEWVILLAWPVAVPAAQVIVWWRRRHPQPFRRSRTDKPNAVLADAAPDPTPNTGEAGA